jgi:hypothetical protein
VITRYKNIVTFIGESKEESRIIYVRFICFVSSLAHGIVNYGTTDGDAGTG